MSMAFSFADVASGLSTAGERGVQVHDGPDLPEIQTDQLGFSGVNGEARARITAESWPADNLPIPTASLLSVASSQGLVAAAGPDSLVIATTADVRSALRANSPDTTRTVSPIFKISHTRLAHVAFSADESVLVVSKEEGGGLAVYQVDQLKRQQSTPALELATNGRGLRTVVANPAVQSAHLFACVTVDGDLLLADLSKGALVHGAENAVLAQNASAVSWSNKGKQMVVGLLDGTAIQMKPDGTIAARIPKSTTIPDGMHISTITWLENDVFLVIYTPSTLDTDQGIPPSEYYIITRSKNDYTFQKLPEIVPPFGLERVPTFHFVTRLRDWKPHITDLILLSSTTGTDVGLITKADHSLSISEAVTNSYALTMMDDDTRRAALPLSNGQETSPIGMAPDLSATEAVVNPIPTDPEIEESAGPAPNIMVMNHEGVLCSWWIIYNDSIRQKTTFSGFSNLDMMHEARAAASPKAFAVDQAQSIPSMSSQADSPAIAQPKSTFGQANTSSLSPFTNSSAGSAFSNTQSAFGSGAAFGSTSKIGGEKSSWTSTGFSSTTGTTSGTSSSFGQPGFGQPAFGATSGPTNAFGNRSSILGQSTGSLAPAFGQTGFGAKPTGSAFGSATTSGSPFASAGASAGNSGFSSFAGSGGFGNKNADKNENKSNAFAQSSQSPFAQNTSTESAFGKPSGNSIFGQPPASGSFSKASPFGAASNTLSGPAFGSSKPFKLESTFKGDGSAKDDLPKPKNVSLPGFGTAFGNLLNETSNPPLSPTHDREEEMEDDKHDESSSDITTTDRPTANLPANVTKDIESSSKTMITPPSTISQSKATPAQPVSSVFGTGQQSSKTPQTTAGSSFWSFANAASTTPKETPASTKPGFPQNSQPEKSIFASQPLATSSAPAARSTADLSQVVKPADSSVINKSPNEDNARSSNHDQAPLPPDPHSRPDYQAGDTSMSSMNSSKPDDAPLPPDFMPANKSAVNRAEEAPLPGDDDEDDDLSSDFQDSGEDLTGDVSPADEGDDEDDDEREDDDDDDDAATEHVQTSPESSFRGENTTTSISSPTGGLFTKVSSTQPTKPARPLFGEIGATAPSFPPPKPQDSPRSPSPVRHLLPHDTLRPDARSVSAPVRARTAIDQRKFEYLESNNAAKAAQARQEEAARERARLEAVTKAQEQARIQEAQSLEDDEDLRIQHELSQPIQPTENLDPFITYEPALRTESSKADIPGQIERLYQDINSMIYTLGINARSLGSFMAYQKNQTQNDSWPSVLQSETPLDALNDEWFLQDISRLHEGIAKLDIELDAKSIKNVAQKLELCQNLLSNDLLDLRNKVTALRKSILARKNGNEVDAALSAEQSAVQLDLRKLASSVQTNLVAVEDGLSLLRARISDSQPAEPVGKRKSMLGSSPRKPTVEAVTNTIVKMTSMAEKRSADVDVLEGQLRKLAMNGSTPESNNNPPKVGTPQRDKSIQPRTPGSGASSVFYTPESRAAGSARSSRFTHGSIGMQGLNMISVEDRNRWLAKAERKKGIASALKNALAQRHVKANAT